MAKSKLGRVMMNAMSILLFMAFFIFINQPKSVTLKPITHDAILLSYIAPLEYTGKQEYLIATSLKQPLIFDEQQFTDAFLEVESFAPVIDSVIHIPHQFKLKQKA